MQYKYLVEPNASLKIWSFYHHVALKYRHTFSEEDVIKNVQKAVRSIYLIEKYLQRRPPLLSHWSNWHMAHAGKWYYAYTIENDCIIVHDACHQQNMHNS